MQAYEGYFERGRFVPLGVVKIPERKRTIITVLDEPVHSDAASDDVNRRLKALDELDAMVDASADEEVPLFERANLHREVEL